MGKGDVACYDNGKDTRYLMVASRDAENPQTLAVMLDAKKVQASMLEDALSGEKIPLRVGKAAITGEIELPPGGGRLFRVQ